MAVLIGLVLLFAGACYSPDVRQCTRACAADSDCIADQRCNADHFCAAPSVTSCAELADAREPDDAQHPDGPKVYHDAGIDAPAVANLAIHIDGPGSVSDDHGHICNGGDCVFVDTPNVALTLTAVPHQDKSFDRWTSTACMGQPATCHLTPPIGVTAVGAKFH